MRVGGVSIAVALDQVNDEPDDACEHEKRGERAKDPDATREDSLGSANGSIGCVRLTSENGDVPAD